MSTNNTAAALDRQERSVVNLVPQYRTEFDEVLPDHVKAVTFVRLAQAALRKNADLRKAAENDPASLIFALREAARLGHEPGTESFWLVPIGGHVEGWEGYRGVVERMFRAGAVTSVKAEVVRANDRFDYSPDMDRPIHRVDWFGERGPILGAYAYGVMRDGSTSKVVVINREYIEKVKAMSRASNRADSPWQKWEESMVLKTVINRLEPFVPTSSEYLREQLRAVRDVTAERGHVLAPPPRQERVDVATGEIVDGELADDPSDDQDPPIPLEARTDPS